MAAILKTLSPTQPDLCHPKHAVQHTSWNDCMLCFCSLAVRGYLKELLYILKIAIIPADMLHRVVRMIQRNRKYSPCGYYSQRYFLKICPIILGHLVNLCFEAFYLPSCRRYFITCLSDISSLPVIKLQNFRRICCKYPVLIYKASRSYLTFDLHPNQTC